MNTPALLCSLVLLASCDRFAPSQSIVAEREDQLDRGPRNDEQPAGDAALWDKAEKVAIARSTRDCEVRRSGDYVRIACTGLSGNLIEQLAGDPVGVKLTSKSDPRPPFGIHSLVVLPLKQGDRRLIQFARVAANRWEWGASAEGVISAYWLEGVAEPTIDIE